MPTKKQEVKTLGYGCGSFAKKTGYGACKKKSSSNRKKKRGFGCKPVKCVCKPVKIIVKKNPKQKCPEISVPSHFQQQPEHCSEPSGTSCI
ncbi:hypothetical protein [Paenibacillus sp. MMO-58]|uniref:hypothetical protein n=1 Tax=Paenibacillus sp. MMO-58 TaxID=3081290 RepID=UPI003017AC9F